MIKEGECFVYVSSTGVSSSKTIQIPCYPDEVSDSVSVNWSDVNIINRTPILAYNGTGLRNISFSMDLHQDMYTGFNGVYDGKDWSNSVRWLILALRSACYPLYTSSGTKPPMVLFKFGSLMMRGVIRSVGFTWKKPIINKQYSLCTVSINMDEITNALQSTGNTLVHPDNPNGLNSTMKAEWIDL